MKRLVDEAVVAKKLVEVAFVVVANELKRLEIVEEPNAINPVVKLIMVEVEAP